MRKKNKIITIATIIIDIITTIALCLALFLKQDVYYALYWILVTPMLVVTVFHVHIWNRNGNGDNVDKEKSTTIRRSYDDMTAVIVVLNGMLYLTVMFLEMINQSIKTNMFILIIIYVLFVISHLMNFLVLYNANKETEKLVKNTYKKK